MKILIIQLAGLGDIYLTWPTLSALRRKFPNSEVDLLIRKKYSENVLVNNDVSELILVDTRKILEPIITAEDEEKSWNLVDNLVSQLAKKNYDLVINLSFSNFSSHLTSAISNQNTNVRGFTRFIDGSLRLADETSAYFYAQVGQHLNNRVHLAHLFASTADVILQEEDWKLQLHSSSKIQIPDDKYWVLNLDGDKGEDMYGLEKWSMVLSHYFKTNNYPVIVIGEDFTLNSGEDFFARQSHRPMINLTGSLSIADKMCLIKNAEFLVSGNHYLIHLASHLDKKTLNVFLGSSRFWERGPLSKLQSILHSSTPEDMPSDRVAMSISSMMNEEVSSTDIEFLDRNLPVTYKFKNAHDDLQWSLIEALYLDQPFPYLYDKNLIKALDQLKSSAEIGLLQLHSLISGDSNNTKFSILEIIDEVTERVGQWAPALTPLIQWFHVEKNRIGPNGLTQVCHQQIRVFENFISIIDHILLNPNAPQFLITEPHLFPEK